MAAMKNINQKLSKFFFMQGADVNKRTNMITALVMLQ